ncbi:MAG: WYL domain-containing protein [Gammaproteobacteria bacterium]|nr:WYL domain-containing protein [Gammaproteobacteria bacterium]MBU1655399.1 WYL domain-containing protein [Gammaproteobacteria bacterium]MBU1960807.1 WYL domain-containing protein [Gammaproteobacteria bacterium]
MMDLPELLALYMMEQYLKQLLPATLFQTLRGTFSRARNTLDSFKRKNPHARWIDKVRAVPPSQPMAAPAGGNLDAYDLLMKALHDDKQVRVMYCPAHEVAPKEYILHPLGLILRPPSLYLAASAWHYPDVLLYALHRFTQVEILDDKVVAPAGFDLDRQIEQGLADFGERIDPIDIELRVSDWLFHYLKETPLAVRGMPPVSTQKIDEPPEADGRYRVRARVNDTWQLRWWILSQGAGVEVVSPPALRDEIAGQLKTAAAIYP